MKRISALILCAGKGSRAGSLKPLMPWKDETFLAKVFRSLDETKLLREIVIVTGAQGHALGQELKRIQARFTANPFYEQGMNSSIRWGLTKFQKEWDGVMIALVDQPHLDMVDYLNIIEPYLNSEKTLCRPTFNNQFGNPCIIGREHFAEILNEKNPDQGYSRLFKAHPQEVLDIKMNNGRCLLDFDTQEALDSYIHRNM